MLIFRVFRKALLQSAADSLFHFSCRRTRKGYDEKLVNVDWMHRVFHHCKDPLYQNRRLSGTRRRADQKIPVSRINDFLLFRCPFYCHVLSLFFLADFLSLTWKKCTIFHFFKSSHSF